MSEKFDKDLAAKVISGFEKLGFVPMPGGQQEPVAGASPATAALAANQPPPGAGPGGPGQGMPPGGAPPPPGAGAPPPPELLQAINDPMVAQMLQQAGIQVDPASGMAMDTQTGQQIPPQDLMMVIQQIMGQMGGGMPPGGEMPPEEGGAPPEDGGEGETADPHLDMLIEMRDLLVEIRDNLKMQRKKDASSSGGSGGGESKETSKPQEPEKDNLSELTAQVSRTNDLLQGMMGGGM